MNWLRIFKTYFFAIICCLSVFFAAIVNLYANANTKDPNKALEDIQRNIAKIQPELKRLSSQKSLLKREKINLSERLVIITEKVRATQERINYLEDEIKASDMREQALAANLQSRKAETAKILAAMGRLSLSPSTPLGAIEDEEKTIHTVLILKNITAELKKRADTLVEDIDLLRSMRNTLKDQRRKLAQERLVLDADSERLKILVETRQNNILKTDKDLVGIKDKLKTLSKKEKTIEGLIEKIRLEEKRRLQREKERQLAEIEQAKKTAQKFKNQKNQPPRPVAKKKTEIHKYNKNIKLLSLQQYLNLQGQLARPISGKVIHQYGMRDKTGKKRQGITIQSKASGIVTAPVNARVIFADNFKRQGSIVILNPAGKYYIVLSGLGVINVSPGQNVAMGEPIGSMKPGIGQRNLYVEFRKDRTTINPNKWIVRHKKTQVASRK